MKICFVTDLAIQGSGYMSLSLPICMRLAEQHEIKVIGLGNRGEQHPFPFTIFPAPNMETVMRTAQFLYAMWEYDVLMVALDIPVQDGMLRSMANRPFKYVGIFPVESDPLCMSWAMVLQSMDKPFIISEFGTREAHRRHIDSAEHLPVGIDTSAWTVPSDEVKRTLRANFGIEDDEFVVLTVADNQERKNLWVNMKAFALFAKDHPRSRYMLVTREHSPAGWKLRDLAFDPFGIGERESKQAGYDISDKLMIFERGMPFPELWKLYAMSDAFLLLSKAEGLGLPLMEAMSVGLPCVGTDCTGIAELITQGAGLLVPPEYTYIDPFGNGRRYCANAEDAAAALSRVWDSAVATRIRDGAREFIETRTWDRAVEPILDYLKGLEDEQKEQEAVEAANPDNYSALL